MRRVPGAETEYSFRHALIQEAAYASLLHRTRRDIHRAVARIFEETYRDRLDEFAGLIHASTDRDALRARLDEGPFTLYYVMDPSADSLHTGNLIGLVMLRRFQLGGHRPIALAGGASEPTVKSRMRYALERLRAALQDFQEPDEPGRVARGAGQIP